jgi:heavy metal efflux system protein
MTTELRPPAHGASRHWFSGVLARGGTVLTLAALWVLAGAWFFSLLPRDLFPNLVLPTIQLLIQGPGRGAAELELAVAQPVEQALAGLPGVRRTTSTVQSGIVQVVVAFDSDSDPWRSRQLVAERLAQVVGEFPEGTTAPLLTSAAGRLQEIQELVLEGPAIDPMRLRDHAVKVLVPRLQSIAGVARVEMLGGEGRQLQISISPEKMRISGVSLEQVIEALGGTERDVSAGVLEIRDKQWNVQIASLAAGPEEVGRLPVHGAFGLVALADVAEIREAPEFRTGLARYQGFEAVSLRVVKQPTAETLRTAAAVRASLPELQASLPAGMQLGLFYDQGELVGHALGGVGQALMVGAIFVALVLVLLLGSLRGAAIVVALLPLATLGAAIPLYLLGLGLNAMTLGGLAISVGLLVDAGVIMVENLAHRLHEHRRENGKSRSRVVARAAAEVAMPIATAVLVILAVFIPLLALGGVAGKLYAPLAVAVASAMALSLLFSFTLVPVLVWRFLPPGAAIEEPAVVRAIKRAYRPVLDFALRRGGLIQILALLVALPSLWLAIRLGSDFLPELNEGALMAQTLLPSDASLAAIDSANRLFEEGLAGVPGIASVYRRTGRGEVTEDPMPTYLSDVLIVLDEGADPRAVESEVAELGEKMPFGVEITTPMNMRISEGIGGTPADIQVELFNPDLSVLAARQAEIQSAIAAVPGVASVTVDTGAPLPSWRITPDDAALRRLDVPRAALLATVRAALQGIPLEPRYDGLQRIERVVRFPSDGRTTTESLKRLPIVVEEGRVIELGQVATLVEEPAPSMIRRKNGQRRLGFNVRVEEDLGGTAKRLEAALARLELPPGTALGLAGKIEEARETQRKLLIASAAALFLVILLLYLALGRWREVAVVLGTLPLAFAGGLYALYLADETWNASSIVGVIGLFGVAVQNSLVLITQTKELLSRGLPFREALRDASLGRVRPKLMTAGAAILGLLPMLFGVGGSELERPLAVVMVGGLVTSTLFTLLVLPSVYARFGAPAEPGVPGR